MKHLKTYESFDDFNLGDYVKLSNKAINEFLRDVKRHPKDYENSYSKLTENDLKNKIFQIDKYDIFHKDPSGNPTVYKTSNLDELDDFNWGWSSTENLRHLTPEEQDFLELKMKADKYNL